MLIYVIPTIAFLSSISQKIVGWTVKLLSPGESPEAVRLRRDISAQKASLAAISMVDEFPAYARAERQLQRLQAEASALASRTRANELKLRLTITAMSHGITGLAMLYVLWTRGSEPVLQLPPAALYPLGYLLAVPGCPLGSVSAASWIVISTSVVRRAVTAVIR